jgi:hypothetical protein
VIILRRFGILALGVILLGVGFGFAFTTSEVFPFKGGVFSGTYQALTASTGFATQPIALGTNGVWCLAAIILGTALVAGWIAVVVHARLLSRRANHVELG